MKGHIWKDEWYPVFGISQNQPHHEIPEPLAARYLAALTEFEAVQDELEQLYKAGAR